LFISNPDSLLRLIGAKKEAAGVIPAACSRNDCEDQIMDLEAAG
jgi:hypothetical protein